MSFLDGAINEIGSVASSAMTSTLTALQDSGLLLLQATVGAPRTIGGVVADVTVEEEHSDEVTLTQHPVETGAAISDHAYKKPPTVRIKAGFSNSNGLGGPVYATTMYDLLLAMQAAFSLLTVVTGKRVYSSMVIRRLSTLTTEHTENVLLITVELEQVILVNTSITSSMVSQNPANPSSNAGVANTGTQQLQSGSNYNTTGTTSDDPYVDDDL